MNKILHKINALEQQKQKLIITLNKQRANKTFVCEACGSRHKIKECTAIQTHWYVSPSGCMDGDYWCDGEIHIVCPSTKIRNRILFETPNIDWAQRDSYEWNLDMQFKYLYSKLFKELVNEYEKNSISGKWINNFCFDKNHEKFDLTYPSTND